MKLTIIIALYCLFSISGAFASDPKSDFPQMDSVVAAFMGRYDINGVSVAVVKDERLVYAKSYGYQDFEQRIPTTNNNLFRIASISKPITLLGLLTLVDQGKLSLDDTVFGANGVLGDDFGAVPEGSGKDKITIKNMIEHRSGWQNKPSDPMFSFSESDQRGVIREVLANRPLSTEPGENYYYSNFCYCILGRVIEKLSGMNYDDFIQKYVLQPCGITDMLIGGNTLSQRLPNEVKYYAQSATGFRCYNMDVSRMDSHGGWIASATDLARLMVHIDRNTKVKDILPADVLSRTYMKNQTWEHTGALPGTATIMRRMDDHFTYVVLANGRSYEKDFWTALSKCGSISINLKKEWSTYNLF